MRQFPEADAANTVLAEIGMGPATDLTTVVSSRGKLRRSALFDDHRFLGHNVSSLLRKRAAHQREQLTGFLVGFRRCDKADIHTADLIDLIVIDLGEHQLLTQAG